MSNVSIVGIDPGIIHTGCVNLVLNGAAREVHTYYELINGVDTALVTDWVTQRAPDALFIEDYNPGNYVREDKKMSEALGRLQVALPPSDTPIVRYVNNAGINTLIPPMVVKAFGVSSFPVSTHHNDLVSAGKIALLGMLQDKDNGLRERLSSVVERAIAGLPWKVMLHA